MSAAAFDTQILIDALRGDARAGAELQRYRQRFISRLSWSRALTKSGRASGGFCVLVMGLLWAT